MSGRWFAIALLVSGCVKHDLVECGDELCPIGYSCDLERSICALPNGLSIPAKLSIDRAPCGAIGQGTMTVRNLGSETIPYSTILSDVGVIAVPPTGSFPPGNTTITLTTTVPEESLPGRVIEGSLLLPLADEVIKRPLSVTPTGAAFNVSTRTLSFGESAVATTTTKNVLYTNTGNVGVNLTAALPPGAFSFAQSPTLHLEPGDTRALAINFLPGSIAGFAANLTASVDAALCQKPLDTIPLTGAATADALLVDSLAIDFGNATCQAPSSAVTLGLTNNNAMPQDVSFAIDGTDAALFAADTTSTTIGGNGIFRPMITRRPIPLGDPGTRTALLTISGTVSGSTTTKMVTLVQHVIASKIALDMPCLPVTEIAGHSSVSAVIGVTNLGNATAAVTITTPPVPQTTATPSSFQVAPGATVPVTYTINNTSSFYVDLMGTPLGSVSAINSCNEGALPVAACGDPQ